MAHAIQATIMAAILAGIPVAAIVGAYQAIVHGPRRIREAEVKKAKQAVLQGRYEQSIVNQAVDELHHEGRL